jgi:hypothetical protein
MQNALRHVFLGRHRAERASWSQIDRQICHHQSSTLRHIFQSLSVYIGHSCTFSSKKRINVYVDFKKRQGNRKKLKAVRSSSPYYPLFHHNTFSQTETGATVPLNIFYKRWPRNAMIIHTSVMEKEAYHGC